VTQYLVLPHFPVEPYLIDYYYCRHVKAGDHPDALAYLDFGGTDSEDADDSEEEGGAEAEERGSRLRLRSDSGSIDLEYSYETRGCLDVSGEALEGVSKRGSRERSKKVAGAGVRAVRARTTSTASQLPLQAGA
jgi:hypothetical protein